MACGLINSLRTDHRLFVGDLIKEGLWMSVPEC